MTQERSLPNAEALIQKKRTARQMFTNSLLLGYKKELYAIETVADSPLSDFYYIVNAYDNLGIAVKYENTHNAAHNFDAGIVAGIQLFAESQVVLNRLMDVKILTGPKISVAQTVPITKNYEKGWEQIEDIFFYSQNEAYKAYLRGQVEGWGKILELMSGKNAPLSLFREDLLKSTGKYRNGKGGYTLPTGIVGIEAEYEYFPDISIPTVTFQIAPIL